MSDQEIINRIQQLPEEQVSGTHLSHSKIAGLLKRYRDLNNAESGEFIVEDFFKENKIPCHHVKIGPQAAAILESLIKELKGDEKSQRAVIESRIKGELAGKAAARG